MDYQKACPEARRRVALLLPMTEPCLLSSPFKRLCRGALEERCWSRARSLTCPRRVGDRALLLWKRTMQAPRLVCPAKAEPASARPATKQLAFQRSLMFVLIIAAAIFPLLAQAAGRVE